MLDQSQPPPHRKLGVVAARQHGVVGIAQLHALGLSTAAVHERAKAGRLHRVHRGVYAVGHARLTLKGRWMAAVLAYGEKAVLSHRAALALHNLRPVPGGAIDVTVQAGGRRSRPGIRIHRTVRLDPRDLTTRDGIPVTTVARTMLDYADTARPQQLRLALEAAERQDALNGWDLNDLLARSPGRRGAQKMRDVLAQMRGPAPWTQSELENNFLALIREAGLPEPQANIYVHDILVDVYWPQARLVVELDGFDWHKTRESFEQDRRDDAVLALAGIAVLRLTDARIRNGARSVVSELRTLIARRQNLL